MKFLFSFLLVSFIMEATAQLTYPISQKGEQVDQYFGTGVKDPYRWLEDDKSDATKAWVTEQNKVTFAYLDKIPYRAKFKAAIEKVFNYPKYSAPFRKGEWYYFYKNDGLQNQSVLYR
jgi:prolyl oligopeptidase